MAITKVKKYTSAPYYDDYDETKNYHRVLFRPGYAVQAWELTQLQTSFQSQLDRFGQFAFVDGARVVSGKPTLDVEYCYIKIEIVTDGDTVTKEEKLVCADGRQGIETPGYWDLFAQFYYRDVQTPEYCRYYSRNKHAFKSPGKVCLDVNGEWEVR